MKIEKKWSWLILLLPLIPWLIGSTNFFYPKYSEFSDLTITHLPNAIYLLHSIKTYGEIPFWSDLIFSGYPFAANPLSGLWYPPGWVAYGFPLPFGFNLAVFIHLLWGAIGIQRFLNFQGLRQEASLLGAIGFLLMPKLFAHFGAGHITLIYAISWTPWLLYNHCANKKNSRWLISASILGLIALADVRWLAYAVLLWGGFVVYETFFQAKSYKSFPINRIVEIPVVLLVAVLLAAVLLLPLAEYTQLSTRALMRFSDLIVNSLPFEELLGLWIPDFGGYAEWVLYPGAVIFCLGIYSFVIPSVRKKTMFWWLVVLITLILSFGRQLPFYSVISSLPGMDLLRVPTRFYFLGGIGFSILAAFGLNDLLEREKIYRPDPVFFMTPFAAFTGFLGIGFLLVGQAIPENLIWGLLCLMTVLIFIAAIERNRNIAKVGGPVLILFLVVDLSFVNLQSIKMVKRQNVFSESQPVVEYLKSKKGFFRIYTPSYSIPQHIAALHQIKMANGIDPLIIKAYQEYFKKASGVPLDSYSVTLPPFPNDEPKTDNQNFTPDLELMSLVGVRFLVSEFDIPSFQPYLIVQFSDTRIYENPFYNGMAWVEKEEENLPVSSIEIHPNKIEVTANGPGNLFLSQTYYPGWLAFMDERPVSFTLRDDLFPILSLPEGEHVVRFEFRPPLVRIGLTISVMAWLVLMFLSILKTNRCKK